MTDEQKYMEILKELGYLLLHKNSQISMQEYQIERLERKINKAENQLADQHKEKEPSLFDSLMENIVEKHGKE